MAGWIPVKNDRRGDRSVGLQADVATPVVGLEADAPVRRAATARIFREQLRESA